jgi:transposase
MGRSRGGLTTKIHALVDAWGLPILLKLTEGQAHDGRSADDTLGSLVAATCCSPIEPMIPMLCMKLSPHAVPRRT